MTTYSTPQLEKFLDETALDPLVESLLINEGRRISAEQAQWLTNCTNKHMFWVLNNAKIDYASWGLRKSSDQQMSPTTQRWHKALHQW